MHIEHSLAAQQIARALSAGYSRESAITQAAKFVKSQDFSMKYAKEVAAKMADLL